MSFLLLFATGLVFAQPTKPLVIGLTPKLSTRTLLMNYQPMQRHLEARLDQEISLFTAPNYSQHYERAMLGEYDVVVLPAHLAQLLKTDADWVPLAQYARQQEGLILVRTDSPIVHTTQLLGKTIALSDRLSLNAMIAEDWFIQLVGKQGPKPRLDQFFSNHAAALQAVVNGSVNAAIVSSVPYSQTSENLRKDVRIIGSTGSFPANIFLVNPAMPGDRMMQVQKALLEYAQTPSGMEMLRRTELDGIRPVLRNDLKWLTPYANRAKAIMQLERER